MMQKLNEGNTDYDWYMTGIRDCLWCKASKKQQQMIKVKDPDSKENIRTVTAFMECQNCFESYTVGFEIHRIYSNMEEV